MKSKKFPSVVLIGSGNVATQLGSALRKQDIEIKQVYSRTLSNAKKLAKKLDASSTSEIEEINNQADIYFVCLTDDTIESFCKKFHTKKLMVHTAGSVALDVLKLSSDNVGVLYPLQTLSKSKRISLKKVPFFIEANNDLNLNKLKDLADLLSDRVYQIDSKQRMNLHVAAVFACNFSNYMFCVAEEILKQSNIKFDLLKPLISETVNKIQAHSPAQMQTGPAIRNDLRTIKKHLDNLENPEYRKIYKLLSENISKMNK